MPRSRSRSPRRRRNDRSSPVAAVKGHRDRRSDAGDARGDGRRDRPYPSRRDRDLQKESRPDNRRYRYGEHDDRERPSQDSRPREEYRKRTYGKPEHQDRRPSRNSFTDEERPTSNGFTFDDPSIVPKGMFYEHDRRENFTGTGGSHSFFKAQDRDRDRGRGSNRRSGHYDRYRNQSDRPRYTREDRSNNNSPDPDRREVKYTVKSDYFGYRTDPLEERRSHGFDRRGRGRGFRPYENRPFQKRQLSPTVWKHDKFEQIEREAEESMKLEDVSD
uniref:Btz domain-containing protein n=1 Tax=Panagrellus redivivus TaxID=6233 RepID=A0A7E4W6T6_PANRE